MYPLVISTIPNLVVRASSSLLVCRDPGRYRRNRKTEHDRAPGTCANAPSALCRKQGVKPFDDLGSGATSTLDLATSDPDVVVEFGGLDIVMTCLPLPASWNP